MKDNTIDVFISDFPFETDFSDVCRERKEEIEKCKSIETRNCKLYAWKLLQYGLKSTLKLDLNKLRPVKNASGKWTCDKCEFSLSHSSNIVAAAISNLPVGIDVELLDEKRFGEKLLQRIATENEKNFYYKLNNPQKNLYTNELWTKKEAVFKLSGESSFLPQKIDTGKCFLNTGRISNKDRTFIVTTASASNGEVKYHILNDIKISDSI